MENKGFVVVLLLLASALFFAGCVQTSPGKPTPVPSASPTVAPVACMQDVYVSCPDGFKYLKAQCVNKELKDVLYLVDPCVNHQLPSQSEQPSPTLMPTVSPLPSATTTVNPTITPSPNGCTQNVTKKCKDSEKMYLDSLCQNGVLTKINYFADPCAAVASATACAADLYNACANGDMYLSASCIEGVLYQVSYFKDPCA